MIISKSSRGTCRKLIRNLQKKRMSKKLPGAALHNIHQKCALKDRQVPKKSSSQSLPTNASKKWPKLIAKVKIGKQK